MNNYTGPHPDRWSLPYIGITGITTEEQVRLLIHQLTDHEDRVSGTLVQNRLLMVGILVSDKTMRGEQNRWPNRYPKVEDIAGIFRVASSVGDVMTTRIIHYNTHDPATLDQQLLQLYEIAGGYIMSGVQLNVAWPSCDQIIKYRQEVPITHRIILQISAKAMSGLKPEVIGTKVLSYGSAITDVLVDPSSGQGIETVQSVYHDVLDEIQQATEGKIGLGYAGGLSAASGERLEELYRRYPNISIDAEGRLRDADDNLDVLATLRYLETSIAAIRKSREPEKG